MDNSIKWLSDNEAFVHLVQLLKDDEEIRSTLLPLIKLSSTQRNVVLNEVIDSMIDQIAPPQLVEAMEAFRDDEVVAKIKSFVDINEDDYK